MEEADFSEDTTYEQQEDLPYDGDLSRIKTCNDFSFTSNNDTLDVPNPMISAVDDPPGATCRHTVTAMTLGEMSENAVNNTYDKEKQCGVTLHIFDNKGDTWKSNISDILRHHLSKEQFLRGQGIDCETLPEISKADSLDEASIIKDIILRYKNSWPKKQTPEVSDLLNPRRDDENSNKPSCSPILIKENTSHLEGPVTAGGSNHQEDPNFLAKIRASSNKQNSYQGQAPQKQQAEKASSSNGFKYGQGQVHYQLPDFSRVAPKVKIPKNNIINKPLSVVTQASSPVQLRNKLAVVRDSLETTSRSNCLEKQHQEHKKIMTDLSQIQVEPMAYVRHELLTGIESETSPLKLSSNSQKDPSSSSYIFQRISHGKQMCQKLKEQTDQLKTKVQEFSKRIKQDSTCHLQDRKLVLEELQGHLELLEQEFVANKEQHLTLQQQVHKLEFPTIGDFDPERKMEGEIFKLKMLLENVREKIDESKYTSALCLPASSPSILDDLAPIASSPSNEIPKEHPSRPPAAWCSRASEATGTSAAGSQEAASSEELRELLAPQTHLNGPSGDAAAQDQQGQMAWMLSSNSREDPSATPGRQECAEMMVPSPNCASCRRLLEWKQKMEKKGYRKINCGQFSIVIQEKVPRPDWTPSSDTGNSFCSDSGAGLQHNRCEDCGVKMLCSRRICSNDPAKEFHYRYNTPGQNYLNHNERVAFVQSHSVDENKNSSPSCSKPKRICSQRVNSKSFQGEYEPMTGKKNLKAFRTYSSQLATSSPHSCRISGNKSLGDFNSIEETESKILNSALDQALKTATTLKETTDKMIKAIAEDLAKAQRWRNRLKRY
ncbi:protein AKNAD1 [Tupaia chinensis]|uniref:protein AKNAD1 n=1 Tax=Tupaia chinensis TaxID=246437 RepID=UPI0003C8E27F|nr:protein AKNAD1 [Tupaia chinensis]